VSAKAPDAVRPGVMFYVQHLLGIGHLKRAATLARAFGEAGLDVTLVSGGQEVPGLQIGSAEFVQLAPLRAADSSFRDLVNDGDEIIDDDFRETRRRALLDTFHRIRPSIILTELFPFGRRQLAFEILPLLEAARSQRPRPCIVSSVRDILVESPKPERTAEMLQRAEQYYDLVLVHGDPAFVPFDETFPPARRIADKIRYTGYVVEAPTVGSGDGDGEVIVSAGGGALSEPLFRAAMAARRLTRLRDRQWRMLAGYALPEEDFRALQSEAPAGVMVERARSDFTQLLAGCALSISQGGYNTVMDILAAKARAVIVPFSGGAETEQTLRARRLSANGAFQVVSDAELSSETLAQAADAALDNPPAGAGALNVEGAAASAGILLEHVAGFGLVAP